MRQYIVCGYNKTSDNKRNYDWVSVWAETPQRAHEIAVDLFPHFDRIHHIFDTTDDKAQ